MHSADTTPQPRAPATPQPRAPATPPALAPRPRPHPPPRPPPTPRPQPHLARGPHSLPQAEVEQDDDQHQTGRELPPGRAQVVDAAALVEVQHAAPGEQGEGVGGSEKDREAGAEGAGGQG